MTNPIIFRAYDIRGSSLSDITPDLAYKVGFCFANHAVTNDNQTICVGRDGRLSSDALYQSLVLGITDGGGKVISVGIVPTPVLYFADAILKPAASIMITGSHNQKDDNGFKMVVDGKSFFGEQIQYLLKMINNCNWNDISKLYYKPEVIDINSQYITRILENTSIDSKLKIAWDPGNGAACFITQLLKQALPNNNIIINGEIDGNFPNHHPDPTVPQNLVQLIEIVKTQDCDCGIAFDGDADRIGVVTNKGNIVWGDQLLCFFANEILLSNPKAKIIADVKASQIVFDQIELNGGVSLMWKTGHSLIKSKMQETGALLAGEMSGHLFFADRYYGYDDGIYAAIRLLNLLSKSAHTLDEILSQLPKTYSTPEVRIKASNEMKLEVINKIKIHLANEAISFNDIDGLRVSTENGWWLLRASNTEDAIIARCESLSDQGLKNLISDLNKLLLPFSLQI